MRPSEIAALPELAGGSPGKDDIPGKLRGDFLDIGAPFHTTSLGVVGRFRQKPERSLDDSL